MEKEENDEKDEKQIGVENGENGSYRGLLRDSLKVLSDGLIERDVEVRTCVILRQKFDLSYYLIELLFFTVLKAILLWNLYLTFMKTFGVKLCILQHCLLELSSTLSGRGRGRHCT